MPISADRLLFKHLFQTFLLQIGKPLDFFGDFVMMTDHREGLSAVLLPAIILFIDTINSRLS
jgi:hypothetical protein